MNAREAASASNVQFFERLFVAHLAPLPPEVTDLRLPVLWGGFRTVHSRYQRASAELPWKRYIVAIHVQGSCSTPLRVAACAAVRKAA